jgi:hypothetical protein
MDMKTAVTVGAFAVMIVGSLSLVINRVATKKGIGARALQWLSLVILPPTIIILAVQGLISSEIAGAATMAIVGFAAREFIARE